MSLIKSMSLIDVGFHDAFITEVWFQLVCVWERNGHLEHIILDRCNGKLSVAEK